MSTSGWVDRQGKVVFLQPLLVPVPVRSLQGHSARDLNTWGEALTEYSAKALHSIQFYGAWATPNVDHKSLGL